MLGGYLDNVRIVRPLVHSITNYVTAGDVANAILACSGSPIMSDDPREAIEITSICSGLNLNIGTLSKQSEKSMFLAGKCANVRKSAVLLDPVGAGSSELRTGIALRLLESIHFDAIRGNLSEIKSLFFGIKSTCGVDANSNDEATQSNIGGVAKFAKDVAKKFATIVVVTGAIDIVSDKIDSFAVYNGHPKMRDIAGTGCMLSGVMTAFLAANVTDKLTAALAATCTVGLAGEIGYARLGAGDGIATYKNNIIDAISNMDGKMLDSGARYESLS